MKALLNCVVDSIVKDLQTQIRMDRTAGTTKYSYIAESIRISFASYTEVSMCLENNNWSVKVSVISIGGIPVAKNIVPVTLHGENGRYVPHWGRISEAIRDTIAAYIRY